VRRMAETYPWRPDWCLAPSETLKDWLSENGMSPRVLSVACGGKQNKPAALTLITEVLERKPLTEIHADCLARGTFVPARFWLALEMNYRNGLAAGLKDASEDEQVPDPVTHLIYCKGCRKSWLDPPGEGGECACTCADPADPLYEAWVTDAEAEAVRKCSACPAPATCSEFGRCPLDGLRADAGKSAPTEGETDG
jgi:hypothetical protein